MNTLLLLPPLAILTVLLLVVTLIALSYRRSWLEAITQRDAAEAKAQHWFSTSRSLGRCMNTVRLTDEEAKRVKGVLFPADLPIGTTANPILCSNGDSARFATVEDLLR